MERVTGGSSVRVAVAVGKVRKKAKTRAVAKEIE